MTVTTHDQPLTLVERLRNIVAALTTTTDADGDPLDLSEVAFEPEELHDFANLYREAADALDTAQAELAHLTTALASACIREAITVIRTEARIRKITHHKSWHVWARKVARAEGDEYASAMPATLQAKIVGRVEDGELALRILSIRRRVELVRVLCDSMGLGAARAAELAHKAALWTDAEVAEIEAFRASDWTGTKLNPLDHLPDALERILYPRAPRLALHTVLTSLLNAEPALDLEVLTEGESGLEIAARLLTLARQRGAFDRRAPVELSSPEAPLAPMPLYTAPGMSLYQRVTDLIDALSAEYDSGLPHIATLLLHEALPALKAHETCAQHTELPSPEGYTPWISMGNSGWALNGVRVADDVIDAWAHAWGLRPKAVTNLRELVEAAARRSLGQRPVVDSMVATCMWEILEAIEKTDTEMGKEQFRDTVRELARRRHDLMTKEEAARTASDIERAPVVLE